MVSPGWRRKVDGLRARVVARKEGGPDPERARSADRLRHGELQKEEGVKERGRKAHQRSGGKTHPVLGDRGGRRAVCELGGKLREVAVKYRWRK